jgi:hypothetical protein
MQPRRVVLFACSLVALGVAVGVRPACAQAKGVQRSVANILMAPLDLVVSPYTTWQTLDQNLESVESTGGKVAAGIVGYPFTWALYLVLGGFREAAGAAELPVSLALWPVNAFTPVELSPFFDASEAGALVDAKTSVMEFKFGGRWLSPH